MRGHYLWAITRSCGHYQCYKIGRASVGPWWEQNRDSETKDTYVPDKVEINTLIQGSIMGWTVVQRVDVTLQSTSCALVIYCESPGDHWKSINKQKVVLKKMQAHRASDRMLSEFMMGNRKKSARSRSC
jgi:hypothetical protein